MRTTLITALALVVSAIGSMPNGVRAEEVLNAVVAFPKPLDFTKSFLRYVDVVNEAGEGVVQINVQGGPEVIPPPEQGDAVRRGVVDMHYGPATYYLGAFAEADAMVGSNLTPAETRTNGGLEMLGEAFAEKMGCICSAISTPAFRFTFISWDEPERTDEGGIDLAGLKLRSQPIYREFFEKMGVTTVSIRCLRSTRRWSGVRSTGWAFRWSPSWTSAGMSTSNTASIRRFFRPISSPS